MAVRVFLSATFMDLLIERREILDIFRKFRTVDDLDVDLITMEDFGFSELAPIKKCLDQVKRADAYLGIIGYKYGSIPANGKTSYTEREYRLAHKLRLPIFILRKFGSATPDQIESDPEKLRKLNNLTKHAERHHLVYRFLDRSDLGKALGRYLPKELRRRLPSLMATRPGVVQVPYFQQKDRPSLLTLDDAETVETLDVLAWSSIGFLRSRAFIEGYVSSGAKIRVLNVSRTGNAIQLLAKEANKPDIKDELKLSIGRVKRFKDFAAGQPGSIELREIDWLPSSSLFIANGSLPGGTGWVSTYTPDPRASGNEKWVAELSSVGHSAALRFYTKQFETLWKNASKIT